MTSAEEPHISAPGEQAPWSPGYCWRCEGCGAMLPPEGCASCTHCGCRHRVFHPAPRRHCAHCGNFRPATRDLHCPSCGFDDAGNPRLTRDEPEYAVLDRLRAAVSSQASRRRCLVCGTIVRADDPLERWAEGRCPSCASRYSRPLNPGEEEVDIEPPVCRSAAASIMRIWSDGRPMAESDFESEFAAEAPADLHELVSRMRARAGQRRCALCGKDLSHEPGERCSGCGSRYAKPGEPEVEADRPQGNGEWTVWIGLVVRMVAWALISLAAVGALAFGLWGLGVLVVWGASESLWSNPALPMFIAMCCWVTSVALFLAVLVLKQREERQKDQ